MQSAVIDELKIKHNGDRYQNRVQMRNNCTYLS